MSAALLLLGAATSATGQTVRGAVVAEDSGRPLPDVLVTLLDDHGAPVGSTRTDAAGAYLLRAPGPGRFTLLIEPDGYLGTSRLLPPLTPGASLERRVEMPLISGAAARAMEEVVRRERALQRPLEELCGEPLRPWEAGLLVGVARERGTRAPVPRALVRLAPVDSLGRPGPERTAVATGAGAYWFCNVPEGLARVVAAASGFRTDTSIARIRPGTISWYDALLGRAR
ncbi:MAG: hypothetical protein GWM90_24130 [Gemmatimonadetes bacterium]|nr:carboxypeptidase regulatory-like domain-containing protein [Gemmatimonadota bacterium]NIQ57826.1 carboxypeptidase regulatory-like domain-containing protein [Gemmatimonadota bacterium]NIU77979.1 hypothetical protein [Gammaproteobacteria bacterium]NIX47054.1 hypothetical protein [Gemmatimonadota bacterium]NIY11432.1 hypothetical protein [Gemmatimonadota bacterium]